MYMHALYAHVYFHGTWRWKWHHWMPELTLPLFLTLSSVHKESNAAAAWRRRLSRLTVLQLPPRSWDMSAQLTPLVFNRTARRLICIKRCKICGRCQIIKVEWVEEVDWIQEVDVAFVIICNQSMEVTIFVIQRDTETSYEPPVNHWGPSQTYPALWSIWLKGPSFTNLIHLIQFLFITDFYTICFTYIVRGWTHSKILLYSRYLLRGKLC